MSAPKNDWQRYVSFGMSVGVAVGCGIGIILGGLALGIGPGIALCVMFVMALAKKRASKTDAASSRSNAGEV